MPSRLTLLALLAILTAALLAPQIASISHTLRIEISAPPQYVRDKALEYSFVRGALLTGPVPIDALLLTRDEHTFGASVAARNEFLHVEIPGSGTPRRAQVIRNRSKDFAYKELLPYGQRVVHTLRFVEVEAGRTRLEYEKKWKGSVVLYGMGKLGVIGAVGEGSGGLEGLGRAIKEAYEEEKDVWGSARYE